MPLQLALLGTLTQLRAAVTQAKDFPANFWQLLLREQQKSMFVFLLLGALEPWTYRKNLVVCKHVEPLEGGEKRTLLAKLSLG